MKDASLYRVGGNALLLGAIALAVGLLMHPPQPESLAQAAELDMGMFSLSHWLLGAGALLTLGGWIALSRHFGGGAAEGLGTLALSAFAIGSIGIVTVVAPEAVAFPMLAGMAGDVAAEHSFQALNAGVMSLALVAGTAYWLGVAITGFAMTKESAFPRWLGFAGLAIGLVIVVGSFLADSFMVHRVLFLLGAVWVAVTGATMARMGRGAPAAAPAGMMAGSAG